jgi:hypothetical protein
MMPRTIEVKIVADTRAFRRSMIKAQLLFERSLWRRLMLRVTLWRIAREKDPAA